MLAFTPAICLAPGDIPVSAPRRATSRARLGFRTRAWCILIAVVALAMGVEPTQRWLRTRRERERDRAVLLTALLRALDPTNPENSQLIRARGTPKYLVLEPMSLTINRWDGTRGDLMDLEVEGRVRASSVSNFILRNSAMPANIGDLGIAHPSIVLDAPGGAGKYYNEYSIVVPSSGFWTTHPRALGYFQAYLPGYSGSGEEAVVILRWGPSQHGHTEVLTLSNVGNGWKTVFRRMAR